MKTQKDLVEEEEFFTSKTVTRKLELPGIKSLHLKTTEEIAEILTNLIKSQSGLKEFKYVIGEYVEVTTTVD